MTFHRPALLGLLAALACAPVLAQTTAVAAIKSAPHKGEAQALQWFSMLDANNDGRISLDEALHKADSRTDLALRVRLAAGVTTQDAGDLSIDTSSPMQSASRLP